MLKKDLPLCPVEVTLSLIGDKWKILIIRNLLNGTKRFNQLKSSLPGISQKVLTQNLRTMDFTSKSLCRSPSQSGVHFNGFGL
ncbi:transcriptional regulator, HxlR family [Desulfovibrio litoralis DSM 11393]|uniref:Transcriptional regulator, HxlR family n=1 Tax=Desulfovibrio litoralis DSM 11393 TaxID=1121455 RepID=A0A1M7SFI5_9BACT|nr:transcriptional regulator, HxlR family [Desulfovibrio litoralis DSM 11393]